jgi:hypothetical protein
MKMKLQSRRIFIFSLAIILVFACRKSIDNQYTSAQNNSGSHLDKNDSTQTNGTGSSGVPPYPISGSFNCPGPNYGDSIIFPQPTAPLQDYVVKPINNPGTGKYFSWPEGLVLNANTGAIDVTASATGQRYNIGFVKDGTTDTCMQTLIIGGAAFSDSVYVFSKNQKFANPFFNANPNITSVCVGSGPGSPTCQWDINGLAQLQKVIVDNHTGVIDLEKTLNGGAFGPVLINGASVQVDIYYSLTDQSNGAVQHTPVKLIYYDKKSNIPASLLNQVINKEVNIVDQALIMLGGNPRPPLIIITRDN